jgi:hypothetical protein
MIKQFSFQKECVEILKKVLWDLLQWSGATLRGRYLVCPQMLDWDENSCYVIPDYILLRPKNIYKVLLHWQFYSNLYSFEVLYSKTLSAKSNIRKKFKSSNINQGC